MSYDAVKYVTGRIILDGKLFPTDTIFIAFFRED